MGGGEKMRTRFLSSANFHSTMMCSPKNWMNWDMQPAGWVICRVRGQMGFVALMPLLLVLCKPAIPSNVLCCVHTFISGCIQRLMVVTLQVGQAVTRPFPVGGSTAFLSS